MNDTHLYIDGKPVKQRRWYHNILGLVSSRAKYYDINDDKIIVHGLYPHNKRFQLSYTYSYPTHHTLDEKGNVTIWMKKASKEGTVARDIQHKGGKEDVRENHFKEQS